MKMMIAASLVSFNLLIGNEELRAKLGKNKSEYIDFLHKSAKTRYEIMKIEDYKTVDELIKAYSDVDEVVRDCVERSIQDFQPDDYVLDLSRVKFNDNDKKAGYIFARLLDLRGGTYIGEIEEFDVITDGVREAFYKFQKKLQVVKNVPYIVRRKIIIKGRKERNGNNNRY